MLCTDFARKKLFALLGACAFLVAVVCAVIVILLVLKQIGSNSNCSIEEAGADLGIDIERIKSKFKSNW